MKFLSDSEIDNLTNIVSRMSEKTVAFEQQFSEINTLLKSILREVQVVKGEVNNLKESIKNPMPKAIADTIQNDCITPVIPNQPKDTFKQEKLYFSSAENDGFDMSWKLESATDVRAMFEVLTTSATTAEFIVLTERFNRIKMNSASMIQDVCEISGDISNSSSMSVKSCGKLSLSQDRWIVTKKCVIEFNT